MAPLLSTSSRRRITPSRSAQRQTAGATKIPMWPQTIRSLARLTSAAPSGAGLRVRRVLTDAGLRQLVAFIGRMPSRGPGTSSSWPAPWSPRRPCARCACSNSNHVEHTQAHERHYVPAVGTRLHPAWTIETRVLSLSLAAAIRHPGRSPAERQSWLSRHLVQNQSSSKQTAADEVGWRMRPAIIIACTPLRVSSTSGSCELILTAPSTCCAPVAALDGSDVTSG